MECTEALPSLSISRNLELRGKTETKWERKEGVGQREDARTQGKGTREQGRRDVALCVFVRWGMERDEDSV